MASGAKSSADAEHRVEQLRGELTDTLDRLRGNLRPRRLAGEAIASTPQWLQDYIAFLQSPAGLALVALAGASLASRQIAKARRQRRRAA